MPQQPQQQQSAPTDPYAEFGGSIATAPTPSGSATPNADPYAEFGGSVSTSAHPHLGPNGQPNPNNVYRATDEESTPEGAAAALARREAEHPILTAIGKGSGEALDDIWNAVKGTPSGLLHSLPPVEFHDTIKQAVPIFRAYEDARSSGKGVWESMRVADETARQHDAAQQALQARIDEFKKQPGAATVHAVADAAALAATIFDGGALNPANTELPAGLRTVAPVVETAPVVEAETAPARVGTVKNVLKGGQPNLQAGIRSAAQTAEETAAARTTATEAASQKVAVPDEYKAAVAEAMGEEPAWTPDKAKPVVKSLGKDFEVRGSVAEGKSTANDLDIWQKQGKLADASDALGKHGFEYSHDTPHGEVWTNPATDQHIDLWDAEHEPIKGFGADTTEIPEAVTEKTSGVRTVIEDVSNSVKAQAQGLYKQLDEASGGRWQRYDDQIKNLNDKMDEVNGVDDEAYERLEQKRNEIETTQSQLIEDMKEKGLDPRIADDAVAHYKQSMALKDLDKAVKGSTSGDVRIGANETVNPKMFQTRVQKLYDSGRLRQALGKEGADTLLKEAYAAKTARNMRFVLAGVAGLAAAYSGVGHLFGVAKTAAEVAAIP